MNQDQTNEKFAIIGLSCLFPGAATPDEYWHNLTQGLNTTSLATEKQFGVNPDHYYAQQRRTNDTTYSLRGGYVNAPIDIPEGMDKAAGWSLYVSREALRDSGYLDRADVLARCGLILGNLSFPTQESHKLVGAVYNPVLEQAIAELTGIDDFQFPHAENFSTSDTVLNPPASIVAQTLGLGGVQFCIDAACASSLYAVGLACAYLNTGQADLMLAGAVSAADPLFVNMGFTHFGAYPKQGSSLPLDANSEGLISGEGAGLLVLKRYEDAVRDGDTIYAVVAGIGLSNDGRGKHPLTPNSSGQILAFQRAYKNRVDPRSVQYIECHASGTPLGDKTELQSMDAFFGAVNTAPLIGSVKANHGHLLTAAGLASILKVILSMQHDQIPATIGVQNPLTSQHFGAAQIVRQNTIWTQHEKTAGINAFGFGGVSAHLILQNPAAAQRSQTAPTARIDKPKLAIVGMDAQFGGCDGLEAFAQTLYDGTQHFTPLPPKRWKGLADDAPAAAYIDSFEIDFLRFKFPPKEDDQPTPQHLLLLKVADNAVQDAGLSQDNNIAVIVVLGTELSLHQYRTRLDLSWQIKQSLSANGLGVETDIDDVEQIVKDAISPLVQVNQYTSYIGNIVSSRVSALWNFSGPAFTLSSAENSVYKALEVAQILLADTHLEAVVVGAIDLAAGVENVMVRRQQHPLNSGSVTLSFDQNSNGWMAGEGAGAVVLKRADKVHDQRVYATLESVSILPGVDANTVAQTIKNALTTAKISPQDIGYIEASASGIAAQDEAEILGLNRIYTSTSDIPQTALGSVKANIGHTGAAAGIASLIKAALCLQRRFIPATPHWSSPKLPSAWENSAFYVAQHSRTWFTPNGTPRRAAISGISEDGTCAHVILSDAGVHSPDESGSSYLKHKTFYLFPIDADSRERLMQRLHQLSSDLDGDHPLPTLAQTTFAAFRNGRYAAVIVGRDRNMIQREVQLALTGIPQAFERGSDWQTPTGSAFSANPLGDTGGIAFVYPGAFNSYVDHGRDWLHMFPSIDPIAALGWDIGDQIAETLLYPRSLTAPDRAQVRAQRARLASNHRSMMESGSLFTVLYTHVMREIFKVKPNITFGYSLGESSMLWAIEVWRDSDQARTLLHHSPLFQSRLSGRKDAIREAWGLSTTAGDNFWASYVLAANPADVHAQLSHEIHVYLTHINTPKEVVIAGEPAACQRVIERLGCESVRAPFETVIHNDAILSEYDAFYRIYDLPVHQSSKDVTFYSAADYEPLRLDKDLIARSLARVSCKQVDFPRLIHRAYKDGARIFIELGPGSTCTRWISDTLRGEKREHVAVSIDALRLDDHTALIKMLARLVSHRVPVDLSTLYESGLATAHERKRLPRTITLGGEPVRSVILSEDNRRLIGDRKLAQRESIPRPALDQTLERFTVSEPVFAHGHDTTLQNRLTGLREIGTALRAQLQTAAQSPTAVITTPRLITPQPIPLRYDRHAALFDTAQIDQFAHGSIAACFGPEFTIYDHQRAPRIPNTDLMLFTRVVEINATRLVTKTGSSMVTEYDVPPDAWFYRDNSYPFAPYSMLMEMALQPCGFLSAYMGPILDSPDIDFYFRNLDGKSKLLREVDLRGRTLVNRVELVSSTILQGIIIQKYTFDMMVDGESFYVGSSTFGYFTKQSLSSQAGLDMGNPPAKWHIANPHVSLMRLHAQHDSSLHQPSRMSLPKRQLAFLDDVMLDIHGGKHGQGYIYATKTVHPSDWYFACHFHQDPVMPGSLGLETVTQAIQTYVLQAGLDKNLQSPRFGHVEDHEAVWKYRGQVLGNTSSVDVEVHIKQVQYVNHEINITADASLWKDTLRIYEFKDVGVRLVNTPNQ
ncbi:MAG: PfaB family protein [Anaerolineae bacterium]|nr:PfaB family protein [Anaerolineae bacterium]